MKYRVGIGQDSHRFSIDPKKKLFLGGVKFDEQGFEANSDGDVIIHALCNALSSSVGNNSIGTYADKMCKKGIIDSKEYLKKAYSFVTEKGYSLQNISISIECKTPKIEPKVNAMKKCLSKILDIRENQISITATSGEELTDFGRGKGVQVFCNVLIRKNGC